MKQLLCLILAAGILLLSGCGGAETNSVSFFYCRSAEDYQYFEETGVIQPENRDITGHRGDIRYVVGLYLAGPLEEGLQSPFTRDTRLISVQEKDREILIQLSDETETLPDASFSLACACLSLTCMDVFSCQSVTISSGKRTITMNENNILLYDTLLPQEATGG
ncbi:MAG: hypothetical protein IJO21_00320 [Oscillospiraceae bacterium]|nr:hypothetical protein [Oscillospiraceae bacterium]